jgi:glutaredoxin
MSLILYSRPECGLCDKAEALLAEGGLRSAYEKVDIESDLELIERYGDQVPVLFNDQTGEKLAWPFTVSQARALIDE